MYININELKIGDRFIEDTWPEIWQVTETQVEENNLPGIRAKVIGRIDKKACNTIDKNCFWGGIGFCLIRWN